MQVWQLACSLHLYEWPSFGRAEHLSPRPSRVAQHASMESGIFSSPAGKEHAKLVTSQDTPKMHCVCTHSHIYIAEGFTNNNILPHGKLQKDKFKQPQSQYLVDPFESRYFTRVYLLFQPWSHTHSLHRHAGLEKKRETKRSGMCQSLTATFPPSTGCTFLHDYPGSTMTNFNPISKKKPSSEEHLNHDLLKVAAN